MYCILLLLTWILSFGRGEKVHKLANVNNKKSNLKRNWFVEGNQRINSRQEVKRQRALKKLLLGLLLVVCPVSCLVQSRTTCPGVGLPTAAWSSHINNQWRKCPLLIIAEILFIFFFFPESCELHVCAYFEAISQLTLSLPKMPLFLSGWYKLTSAI